MVRNALSTTLNRQGARQRKVSLVMENTVKITVSECAVTAPLEVPPKKLDGSESYELDARLEDAVLLLENLQMYGGYMHLKTSHLVVDFNIFSDRTYEVEIFDARDGFGAIGSMLKLNVARRILEMSFNNEKFDECIPMTKEPWWSL